MVAALRIEAGQHPNDRALSDLVGELTTRSDEFATYWTSQNVRFHQSGPKDIHRGLSAVCETVRALTECHGCRPGYGDASGWRSVVAERKGPGPSALPGAGGGRAPGSA